MVDLITKNNIYNFFEVKLCHESFIIFNCRQHSRLPESSADRRASSQWTHQIGMSRCPHETEVRCRLNRVDKSVTRNSINKELHQLSQSALWSEERLCWLSRRWSGRELPLPKALCCVLQTKWIFQYIECFFHIKVHLFMGCNRLLAKNNFGLLWPDWFAIKKKDCFFYFVSVIYHGYR